MGKAHQYFIKKRFIAKTINSDLSVFYLYLFNHLGWNTSNNGIRLHVFCHNSTCCNYGTIANGDSCKDDGSCTYPAAIAYGDRQGTGATEILATFRCPILGQPIFQVNRMRRGVDLYAGSNEHVATDGDAVAVNEKAAVIDAHIIADVDVVTEVADEIGAYRHISAHATEQFTKHPLAFVATAERDAVVTLTPRCSLDFSFDEDWVVAIV